MMNLRESHEFLASACRCQQVAAKFYSELSDDDVLWSYRQLEL